jgi:hypothetical protein
MFRPISEPVLRVAGNFDEVSRTNFDPTHFADIPDQYFEIPRKNEENFDGIVTVHEY